MGGNFHFSTVNSFDTNKIEFSQEELRNHKFGCMVFKSY